MATVSDKSPVELLKIFKHLYFLPVQGRFIPNGPSFQQNKINMQYKQAHTPQRTVNGNMINNKTCFVYSENKRLRYSI